jgi:RNA polymerase primary sigma factor
MEAELAARSGWSDSKVRRILDSIQQRRSLQTPVGEDAQLGDVLADAEPGPDEVTREGDRATQIERSLARLTDRERLLLQLRFGLAGGSEHTPEEIATHVLLTRERIRQIEAMALRKLRHPVRGQALRTFARA